ncbi:MAG: hypothetical protein ACXWW6_07670, partial [Candidatus Limnocylindrales bacterium]
MLTVFGALALDPQAVATNALSARKTSQRPRGVIRIRPSIVGTSTPRDATSSGATAGTQTRG